MLEPLRAELRRDGRPVGVTDVMPASANTPFYDKARTKMGVKPTGFPPAYQPGVVANAILYAAEKAPRDLVVGGAGKAMLLNQRLSPRLMDAHMGSLGYRWQQTDEPKPEDAPDYLFGPVDDRRIEVALDPAVGVPEPPHLARHPPGCEGGSPRGDSGRGRGGRTEQGVRGTKLPGPYGSPNRAKVFDSPPHFVVGLTGRILPGTDRARGGRRVRSRTGQAGCLYGSWWAYSSRDRARYSLSSAIKRPMARSKAGCRMS